jgi:hypothetical protein
LIYFPPGVIFKFMIGYGSQNSVPQIASGLVITLSEDLSAAQAAVNTLQDRQGVELGQRQGRWLPAALCCANPRLEHAWIESIHGVDLVEVVFVGFEDENAATAATPGISNEFLSTTQS